MGATLSPPLVTPKANLLTCSEGRWTEEEACVPHAKVDKQSKCQSTSMTSARRSRQKEECSLAVIASVRRSIDKRKTYCVNRLMFLPAQKVEAPELFTVWGD